MTLTPEGLRGVVVWTDRGAAEFAYEAADRGDDDGEE